MGETRLDLRGKLEAELVIEGDQPVVESRVMESIEGDAVADVEALGFVTAPREDVGGDEEFADGQARDSAAVAVVVQDDLAEEILPAALFGGSSDFGAAGGWARDLADASAGDHLGGFAVGFGEKGVEALLAEWDEFGGVFVKFLPGGSVKLARSREADDAAQPESRVEGGEVV